ncbi:hypothetical protein A3715_17920 [Oleiphilus sp. HI0009]|uniref:hypothetical protein n=3 Tax=Oleiphilus sp. HI0066 TaxID=1822242 RepID=UPI0007C3B785|nr:hypothetical protein [Oleiphilus sp. HI0066]KZX83955.1 hypothetical protein A3715_17920 [Oleiphilus sp. HI0009]KZY67896.1 hypothetical protein A3738_16020 [Oleiphilus sp. HI0066]KZY77429.1 hypothetical protein A3739_02030 [Oleiphilus sp. HI0067]
MKRKLIITAGILIVVGVLLKLALVLISNQVLVQAKDDLVNVGSFQYLGVKTSLLDGEIVVSQPSFKHFKSKQDISADAATLHFDGIFDLILSLTQKLSGDYSVIESVSLQGVAVSLPSQTLIDHFNEQTSVPANALFGWLSCDGQSVPSTQLFEVISVAAITGNASVQNHSDDIELELVTDDLGSLAMRFSTARGLDLVSFQYIENGYFKRLLNSCESVVQEDLDLAGFSMSVIDGWKAQLLQEGFRVSDAAAMALSAYIAKGGVLNVSLSSHDMAIEQAYGWLPVLEYGGTQLTVNTDQGVELGLQKYVPEPKAEPVVESKPVEIEPQYLNVELTELDAMLEERVRITLLNGKQSEGMLSQVDEHLLVITPLNGDGSVSFTFKRVELSVLEVWK